MIDLDLVNITPEFLKGRFDADPIKRTGTAAEKLKIDELHNRIRSRVQEGMSRNLSDWQWTYAIDKALDTPFRQFHPKLFADLDGENLQSACSILKALNLSSLVTTTKSADGKETCSVNEENFVILVGLVTSYTKARWAKIVNDRRLTPFLKFEPAKLTTANRTKCEVLTDRVQVMADQYSYFDVMKQSVFKMLVYSFALQFIKEEWHFEEQLKKADENDVEEGGKNEKDEPKVKLGAKISYTSREGLRYDIPHPSRIYRDLAHGMYTINSDSGCQFAGYWAIVRYRELLDQGFWNDDKVTLGAGAIPLVDYNNLYFTSFYNAIKLAQAPSLAPAAAQFGAGTTSTDRETQLANQFYGTDHKDQGTLVTNHFEKLVPKDNGLGDYPHPVWFRFVLAGDGCTVLYAAPLPGIPMVYYGYDADESRQKNASLAMEILPYQYEFENLLTQIIYSCKQNLSNLTLLNTDVLDEKKDWGAEITGWGPKLWKKINIVGASFKRLNRLLQSNSRSSQDMGMSLTLPKANVAELVNVLRTILDVLERALGMSNQEVAQTASHEISATETRNLAAATSSRLMFTATPVDIARDAWKRQIYAYLMAYGDEDFYGHIPADNEITEAQLKKLGFSYVDSDEMAGKEKYRKVRATKNAIHLPLYEFAATRDGDDRANDSAIAAVMATLARDVMNNPITAAAIGPDQAIAMINAIGYFAGLPRDFKLRNTGKTPEQAKAEAAEQLKQVVEITLQAADKHIMEAITPLLDEVKKQGQEIALLMRLTGAAPPPPGAGPADGGAMPPPGMMPGGMPPQMIPPGGMPMGAMPMPPGGMPMM